MEVKPILKDWLTNTMPKMNKLRRLALVDCVNSIVNGNSLTVTSMGRGLDNDALEKHCIKRSDRLCSNFNLFQEKTGIYESICKEWIPECSRPVIIVDWSNLDDYRNAFLISATLVCDGRSITLYAETHPLSRRETRRTHQLFMETLQRILPNNCQPIILADAGFQVPWHELVLSLGWDYIGRVRKPNHCKLEGEDWQDLDKIFKKATKTAKCYKGLLTKRNHFKTTFVLYKGASKGRHKLTAEGKRCCSKHSKQHATSGKEPWLLATSLPLCNSLAKRVVRIYKSRMQIEEGFRDMKSKLYGLGFNESKSYKINRIAILVLIAILAGLLLIMIGAAAEQAGFAKHFQANTIKHRRVLSLHYLGLRMIAQTRLIPEVEDFVRGVAHMKNMIAQAENGLDKHA